jgi:hypothetical protein
MRKIGQSAYPVLAVFLALLVFTCAFAPPADNAPRMDKDVLRARMGSPDVVILDARVPPEWDMSDFKIKGARRIDPLDESGWTALAPRDKTIVVYCS